MARLQLRTAALKITADAARVTAITARWLNHSHVHHIAVLRAPDLSLHVKAHSAPIGRGQHSVDLLIGDRLSVSEGEVADLSVGSRNHLNEVGVARIVVVRTALG